MILATPIILVESPPGAATRSLCDTTQRLWHMAVAPVRTPKKVKPTAPPRRWVDQPRGNYPVNPVLRARFGEPRSRFSGGLALVITFGLASLIGAALASWALMAQPERQVGNGGEQMAELLPLSAPMLGFEFDRIIEIGSVPSDGNTALGITSERPTVSRASTADTDVTRKRVQPRRTKVLQPTRPSVIADNPY